MQLVGSKNVAARTSLRSPAPLEVERDYNPASLWKITDPMGEICANTPRSCEMQFASSRGTCAESILL
jgi:hypothetical protein